MEKTVASIAGREEEELALGGTRALYCTHGPRAPALNKIEERKGLVYKAMMYDAPPIVDRVAPIITRSHNLLSHDSIPACLTTTCPVSVFPNTRLASFSTLETSQSRLHDIMPQVFQQRPAVDIIDSQLLPQAQTHTSTYAYDRRLMTGLTASNTLAAPWRYA